MPDTLHPVTESPVHAVDAAIVQDGKYNFTCGVDSELFPRLDPGGALPLCRHPMDLNPDAMQMVDELWDEPNVSRLFNGEFFMDYVKMDTRSIIYSNMSQSTTGEFWEMGRTFRHVMDAIEVVSMCTHQCGDITPYGRLTHMCLMGIAWFTRIQNRWLSYHPASEYDEDYVPFYVMLYDDDMISVCDERLMRMKPSPERLQQYAGRMNMHTFASRFIYSLITSLLNGSLHTLMGRLSPGLTAVRHQHV